MIETALSSESKQPIDINHLASARQKASNQGISVIQVLEETSGYTPDELTQQLGRLLHMPVMEMKAIHTLSPAFDLLPFIAYAGHGDESNPYAQSSL